MPESAKHAELDEALKHKKGGPGWRGYLTNFLIGTAATMTAVAILNKISGSGSSKAAAPSQDDQPDSSQSSYPPTSTNPPAYPSTTNYPSTYQTGQNQYGYGQYQNQQRAADRDKRADFFGEPHSSYGLYYTVSLTVLSLLAGHQKKKPDPCRITIGEEKVREYLRFLKRDYRRATPQLELMDRADLGEALKLFGRVIDELD